MHASYAELLELTGEFLGGEFFGLIHCESLIFFPLHLKFNINSVGSAGLISSKICT